MALIRCPGCKLDTSDSLDNCPSCGIALRSGGRSLFAQATAPATGEPPPPPATAPATASGPLPKIVGLVLLVIALSFIPHAFPLLAVGFILWQLAKRRGGAPSNRQAEVLKILVDEVRKAKKSPSTRPLEMLRRIEQQLPKR
jgi:hypothetical protein